MEADLRALMAALKSNNSDEWPGKPAQTPFAVPATLGERGEAPRSVQIVSCSSSPAGPSDGDAERQSLDVLMSEYVGAVADLRRVNKTEEAPAAAQDEAAKTMQELLDELDSLPPLQNP